MSVVNLYTLPNCPKCKILKDICSKSKFIKNSDFEICDATDPSYAEYLFFLLMILFTVFLKLLIFFVVKKVNI